MHSYMSGRNRKKERKTKIRKKEEKTKEQK